jgi:hypothetical protein
MVIIRLMNLDERIKSNIESIEKALDYTLLYSGEEYNNSKIDSNKKCIGLAQEVESIVPEVVETNERAIYVI